MTEETLFQKQLDHIFDRPTETDPAWYFTDYYTAGDENIFPYDNPEVGFVFIENLLKTPKKHLENYSNDQVGLGLNFIFNNACSNLSYDIKGADVSFERKMNLISNLFFLFKDVLNERCLPQTSAYSTVLSPPLNNFCYMFWDITPIAMLSDVAKAEQHEYCQKIAKVMQKCLTLKNIVCVESGLHGLGHMAFGYPKIVVPIIDAFLKNAKNQPANIIEYAKAARTGMIL